MVFPRDKRKPVGKRIILKPNKSSPDFDGNYWNNYGKEEQSRNRQAA